MIFNYLDKEHFDEAVDIKEFNRFFKRSTLASEGQAREILPYFWKTVLMKSCQHNEEDEISRRGFRQFF
jgi:hypothetical protein